MLKEVARGLRASSVAGKKDKAIGKDTSPDTERFVQAHTNQQMEEHYARCARTARGKDIKDERNSGCDLCQSCGCCTASWSTRRRCFGPTERLAVGQTRTRSFGKPSNHSPVQANFRICLLGIAPLCEACVPKNLGTDTSCKAGHGDSAPSMPRVPDADSMKQAARAAATRWKILAGNCEARSHQEKT